MESSAGPSVLFAFWVDHARNGFDSMDAVGDRITILLRIDVFGSLDGDAPPPRPKLLSRIVSMACCVASPCSLLARGTKQYGRCDVSSQYATAHCSNEIIHVVLRNLPLYLCR